MAREAAALRCLKIEASRHHSRLGTLRAYRLLILPPEHPTCLEAMVLPEATLFIRTQTGPEISFQFCVTGTVMDDKTFSWALELAEVLTSRYSAQTRGVAIPPRSAPSLLSAMPRFVTLVARGLSLPLPRALAIDGCEYNLVMASFKTTTYSSITQGSTLHSRIKIQSFCFTAPLPQTEQHQKKRFERTTKGGKVIQI